MMWTRKNLFAVLLISFASLGNAAEFFILPNSKTLLMMGETIPSDVASLSKYIEKGEVDSLMLKGPGGSLEAGYAIADLVLEHQLNVTIPANTDCASACSLIFAAGTTRAMESGTKIGFHLPFIDLGTGYGSSQVIEDYCASISASSDQSLRGLIFIGVGEYADCFMKTYQLGLRDIRKLERLFSRDGISQKVLDIVIETPTGDMTWIKRDKARELGLVND